MMRLGFAHFLLRDNSPVYVNPWAIQTLKPADAEGRTLIVFTNGDIEIVDGYVQNVAGEMERAASDE